MCKVISYHFLLNLDIFGRYEFDETELNEIVKQNQLNNLKVWCPSIIDTY
jgi:hypothetical protein